MRGQKNTVYKNIPLILHKEGFQDAVKQLRKKWRIPTVRAFYSVAKQNTWLAYQSRKTNKDGTSSYSVFLDEVYALRKLFKLPIKWNKFILKHVLTNKTTPPTPLRSGRNIRKPRIKLRKPANPNDPYQIQVELTTETRQEDIKKSWSEIERVKKSLPDYDPSRNKPQIKRDLKTLSLANKGIKPEPSYDLRKDLSYDNPPNKEAIVKGHQRLKKALKRQ
jgi:hypothetical protein